MNSQEPLSSQEKRQVPSSKPARMGSRLRAYHVFFITVSLAAGCMFTFKLFSFMKTIKREELDGFAFDPIMVYACVAMGFLLLLAWAYLTGQFRDIEAPKYEMFEKFAEQERQEVEFARSADSHE